jgi:hypothetical protein
MSRNRSTVDLAERWAQLTGTPIKEATQRVRVLRLDGLLPDSRVHRRALTADEVATFIVGAMHDEHLSAPAMVRKYAKMRPVGGLATSTPLLTRLQRLTLVEAVAELLRRAGEGGPQLAVSLAVSTSHGYASLLVSEAGGEPAVFTYGALPDDADGPPWALQRDVRLPAPVLGRMARMIGATQAEAAVIDAYEANMIKMETKS